MIQKFDCRKTEIEGLYEIVPFHSTDERGGFTKDYSKEVFESFGIEHNLMETFYTRNKKGVIRALHFQGVKPQPKLVRCIKGRVLDAVVDIRPSSPTFKKWLFFELGDDSSREILVPSGCAHGYIVLDEDSIVAYKCSEKFYPEYDDGIMWDDPDIGIDWPLKLIGGKSNLIISEKDKNLQSFKHYLETKTK